MYLFRTKKLCNTKQNTRLVRHKTGLVKHHWLRKSRRNLLDCIGVNSLRCTNQIKNLYLAESFLYILDSRFN